MEDQDRRFQVFLSSTFRDLQDQRKKTVSTIVEAGHIPIALENFSASSESDLVIIEEAIRSSQIYVLILGHRFGEVPEGESRSYTEIEYDLARKHELLILAFVLNDAEVAEKRATLNANDVSDRAELEREALRRKFHERVKRSFFYKPWSEKEEFKHLILDALSRATHKCTKPGLVWERPADEQFLKIASRNPFLAEAVKKIGQFTKLDKRCDEQVAKKQALADFFIAEYGSEIAEKQISVFLESGSTVAFAARALSQFLKDRHKPIDILTNNVLAYLHHWLTEGLPCTLFPRTSPREPYGATFGSIEGLALKAPKYPPGSLSEDAKAEIRKLSTDPAGFHRVRGPALLLGAVSGLQLGDDHAVVQEAEDGSLVPAGGLVREQASQCKGPHVGSYHNKIFKRLMYSSGLPVMLLITEEKIDFEIIVGRCHFILDSTDVPNGGIDLTWEMFINEYPTAFCVGTSLATLDKNATAFARLGFEIVTGPTAEMSAFIARSAAFTAVLDGSAAPHPLLAAKKRSAPIRGRNVSGRNSTTY